MCTECKKCVEERERERELGIHSVVCCVLIDINCLIQVVGSGEWEVCDMGLVDAEGPKSWTMPLWSLCDTIISKFVE